MLHHQKGGAPENKEEQNKQPPNLGLGLTPVLKGQKRGRIGLTGVTCAPLSAVTCDHRVTCDSP